MSKKMRINVEYNGKKIVQPLPDPDKMNFETLKSILADKFQVASQLRSSLKLYSNDGYQIDTDEQEIVTNILDDKDAVIMRAGDDLPQVPSQVPVSVPLIPASLIQAPAVIPQVQPIQNFEDQKLPQIILKGDGFQYRLFERESGFTDVRSFPFPDPKESLKQYLDKILTQHHIPIQNFSALLYHENGAPLTTTVAQQHLVFCGEIIIHSSAQVYYLIVVPGSATKKLEGLIGDPTVGKDMITVEHLGRKFNVNLELEVTTMKELKEKLTILVKIPEPNIQLFIGTEEQLDTTIVTKQKATQVQLIQVVQNRGYFNFMDNFPSMETISGCTKEGIKQFKCCLYILAKRYSADKKNLLLGYLRYVSNNNSPMISAFARLLKKVRLYPSERVAIDLGFADIFRKMLLSAPLPKMDNGEQLTASAVPALSFNYSRVLLMSIFDRIQKISVDQTLRDYFNNTESYLEADFVCAFSNKHIDIPVEVQTDKGEIKICDKTEMLSRLNQALPDIAVMSKEKIKEKPELHQLKNIFYNQWADSFSFWTGNKKLISLNDIRQQILKYPQLLDYTQLTTLANKNEYLRVFNSYSIQYYGNFPCLILNTLQEYAIGEQIMDCGTTNVYYDITTGNKDNILISSSQNIAQIDEEFKDEVVITKEPEEIIVLLFDTSGSMSCEYVQEVSRILAAKTFFNAFSDRAIAYKLQLAIALIIFNDKINLKCTFTERFRSFKNHVERCSPGGTTKLYDAIVCAVDKLESMKAKYPKTIRRVIVFSDGEDVGSSETASGTANYLRSHDVLCDSVLVGSENSSLKAITLASGGYSYYYSDMKEGLQLFESETFLRAAIRKPMGKPQISSPSDFDHLLTQSYSLSTPPMIENPKLSSKVADPKQVIANVIMKPPSLAAASPANVIRIKRIFSEISRLNKAPHPNFLYFISDNDIGFWRIIMIGPTGSPYAGCTFVLSATFPEDFPTTPPELRFHTPIIHCNINKTGRVCHPIFNINYTPSITMKEIFGYMHDLLIEPNLDDQVENTVAQDFYANRDIYNQKVQEYAAKYGKVSLEDRLKEIGQSVEISKLSHPKEYLDPLTKELMLDPVISPVSGTTFHRESILNYIIINKCDPINKKPLLPEQLIENSALKGVIQKYNESLQGSAWFNH